MNFYIIEFNSTSNFSFQFRCFLLVKDVGVALDWQKAKHLIFKYFETPTSISFVGVTLTWRQNSFPSLSQNAKIGFRGVLTPPVLFV